MSLPDDTAPSHNPSSLSTTGQSTLTTLYSASIPAIEAVHAPAKTKHSLDLPEEVLTQLFSYFNWSDLVNLAQTSRALQDRAEPIIWRYYNLDTRYRRGVFGDTRCAERLSSKRVDLLSMHEKIMADHTGCGLYRDVPSELERMWAALRFADWTKAVESRPIRATFIRHLRFSVWLGDVDGWDDAIATLWPRLCAASIDMGQFDGELIWSDDHFITRAFNNTIYRLTVTHRLRKLQIYQHQSNRSATNMLDQIFRLAPDLEELEIQFRQSPANYGFGYTEELDLRNTFPLSWTWANLRTLLVPFAEHMRLPDVTRILRYAPKLTSFELIGEQGVSPASNADFRKSFSIALRECSKLRSLHWFMDGFNFVDLLALLKDAKGDFPELQECGLLCGRAGQGGYVAQVNLGNHP
jgi:hypothetical protein